MLIHLQRRAFVLSACLLLLPLGGCYKATHRGVATQSVSWTTTVDKPIPGVHVGSVDAVTLKHGPPLGVKVVFWGDVSRGKVQGLGSPTGAHAEGELVTAGMATVKYRCESTDGTTATIDIDGQKFKTADGALFLISTQGATTKVKQLKFDVRQVPTNTQGVQQLAAENADISEFFEAQLPAAAEPTSGTAPAP
ncbi:hypothetical protein NA78x_002213 [Anatilimnocola sp. NA78]|uniref:hypothetical protein n=1 Tax=Anatilimnocola sp. NA78 TaxID=3415683 RepID=UPI003CE53551